MKNTVKTAIGGMCMALSVAIMFASSIIPFLTYAIPAAAGLIVMFVSIELDRKWAAGVFVGTAILCAFLVPEKEAVGIYIAMFGYYPLLKPIFDKPKKVISILIKIVYFVVVIVAAYVVMMKVFGISTELLEESSKFMIPIIVLAGTAAFLLYDRAVTLFTIAYYKKWQHQFRKIFKK